MNLVKISYKKHFVSGNLQGLVVDCYFHAPKSSVPNWVKKLGTCTPKQLGADVGGSGEFYVTEIGVENV